MFVHNSVWLMFVLFWLFGMAMASFTCCVSVFLSNTQSASNTGLAIVLVRPSPFYVSLFLSIYTHTRSFTQHTCIRPLLSCLEESARPSCLSVYLSAIK